MKMDSGVSYFNVSLSVEKQSHNQTVSTKHNCGKERRAEAESNGCLTASVPGSHLTARLHLLLEMLLYIHRLLGTIRNGEPRTSTSTDFHTAPELCLVKSAHYSFSPPFKHRGGNPVKLIVTPLEHNLILSLLLPVGDATRPVLHSINCFYFYFFFIFIIAFRNESDGY